MIAEAQVAVRNAGLLMAQKVIHAAGAFLVAVLVPRLMGPDIFGRFALITSISMWFAMFNSLSSAQTMSRFVPQIGLEQGKEGLQKFLGNQLTLRMANGMLSAVLYLILTALWFRELDAVVLVIVAASVLIRAGGRLFFSFFLGLNQAARWGMGEILRQWLSLIFLIPGFYFGGLRGACLGLVLAELIVLLAGLWWAGSYFTISNLRLDLRYLAPYLRFGLTFFASNLLLAFSRRSGEFLVRIASGDYIQVAYFGLAYKIYLLAAQAIWQLTMSFAPLLSSLMIQDKTDEIKKWIERLLKWMAVCGVAASFSVLLLGNDLVPLVFGKDYWPVADNLLPLMAALLTFALASVARLLALTYDRPRIAFEAAVFQLVSFWGLGLPLIAWQGSLAGCLAQLAASVLYGSYYTWRMRSVVRYSLRNWALPILLGAVFLPLALLRSSWPINVALFGLFIAGYTSALLLLKVVTPGEITKMRRALRPAALTPEA